MAEQSSTESSVNAANAERQEPPARSRLKRLKDWVGKTLPWRLLLLAIVAVLLLHLFELIRIPFPPFTTRGTIYVDSPEIYTRERLVNDRYDQDYWLRTQLERLDQAAGLITSTLTQTLSGKAGGTDLQPQTAEGSAAPSPGLTFEQRFSITSGIRDMIRQQILENMLDDRHDLTGNSVYGLKFDTTVIPGANTRQRAFVSIRLRPDDLFAPPPPADQDASADPGPAPLPEHLRSYLAEQCENAGEAVRCADIAGPDRQQQKRRNDLRLAYYEAWLIDIMKRLNQMEDSLYESMEGCPRGDQDSIEGHERGLKFYDALTSRTLRVVLGIPEKRFTRHNIAAGAKAEFFAAELPIALPDPWAKFMKIHRVPLDLHGERACRYRVWFEVLPLYENFVAERTPATLTVCSKRANSNDLIPTLPDGCLIPAAETKDGEWKLFVQPWAVSYRAAMFAQSASPKYRIPPELLAELEALQSPAEDTKAPESTPESMPEASSNSTPPGLAFEIPTGLFNFIEHMSQLDAYAYAIFPKNDVIGMLSDNSALVAGGVANEGMLALARRLIESRTVSVSVGYGDGRPDSKGDRSVRFGWVLSPVGDMQPTLKTQLALVSVPAWTNTLTMEVRTGWLDGRGRVVSSDDTTFEMTVNVPPDFEAFDSIFREDAWVNRGPRIQDDAMDKQIYVLAGQNTRILIPGSRLWRSASVTLGAQTANRIRVLPNMEGIIAEFRPVDLPYAAYNPKPAPADAPDSDRAETEPSCTIPAPQLAEMQARPVRLRVWTSEGVATAIRPVCIVYDPIKQIQGAEPPGTASADGIALAPVGALADGADGLGNVEDTDAGASGAAVPVIPLGE